jgi:hypothetical protein
MTPIDLRKLARFKACQVRLPGCVDDRRTVVLAHFRLAGTCGVAMKPTDLAACWSCNYCHDIIDGRYHIQGMMGSAVRLAHAEAVMRTLAEYDRMGLVLMGKEVEF